MGTFKAHISTFGYLEYVITKSGTTREEPSSQLGYFVLWNILPGFSKKKQPSTGNHIDTLITSATPNFNVVLRSAEHHQQKCVLFEAAKHAI